MKSKEKAKRYKNNSIKNTYILKIVLILIFLFLVITIVFNYKGVIFYPKKLDNKTTSSETKVNNNPEIIENKTVENADYLEITGLKIESKDGYSSVRTSIKNNLEEIIENISLTISIYDNEGKIVAELSNPVKKIEPGETIDSFGIVNEDISESYNYIVKKD